MLSCYHAARGCSRNGSRAKTMSAYQAVAIKKSHGQTDLETQSERNWAGLCSDRRRCQGLQWNDSALKKALKNRGLTK